MAIKREKRRGGALLAVMWLSAALAAIAFSVASTVRSETARTGNSVDDLRSYYLATGSIERAVLNMQWGRPFYEYGQPVLQFTYPSGDAAVEILPETGKLNINQIPADQIFHLLLYLGQDEQRASEITEAILDWRTPVGPNANGMDAFYRSLTPSFSARHSSFEEIEELLSVRGVTPDLFYGTYARDTSVTPPVLVQRGGLKDCVSVFGTGGSVDANASSPAVLMLMGVPPEAVNALVARRPFRNQIDLAAFTGGNAALGRLRVGGLNIFTLRATARVRQPDGSLSDLRRTVAATIKLHPGFDPPYIVLRWYDRG